MGSHVKSLTHCDATCIIQSMVNIKSLKGKIISSVLSSDFSAPTGKSEMLLNRYCFLI